jgi:ferredoxin--NADP+ reductase
MSVNQDLKIKAAIIGAGPAGLFAAETLAREGIGVAVFNRDIKPGGMVEYGIFLDKYNLRNALRYQFENILQSERIEYFGNIAIGKKQCISISDLQNIGFNAILIASGAQGTKWLGIPGEKLVGVYHAKDVVYHYNRLPPYSMKELEIGKKVAIVGAGNVMTDIAHYLLKYRGVREIFVIVRRGPAEVKFEKKELQAIISSFDLTDLDQEFTRVTPVMNSLGQNAEEEKNIFLQALEKASPREGNGTIKMRFLSSPRELQGDINGKVKQLVLEQNHLVNENGAVIAHGTGILNTMELDTVIFAIGDRVEEDLELALERNEYRCTSNPQYPIGGQSYEIADPQNSGSARGLFVAGWARKASSGLVGNAKKDGVNAAQAMISYLNSMQHSTGVDLEVLQKKLAAVTCPVVSKKDLGLLSEYEKQRANELGLPEYKYPTNGEMLKLMGLN